MNRIYRTLWNASLGSWVAVPEIARGGGGLRTGVAGTRAAKAPALRWHGVATAIALAWGLAGGAPVALAACVTMIPGAGGTVECTGNVPATYNSSLNNLTVNVAIGANVYSSTAPDLYLSGNNVTFTNSGTIGPTLLATLVDFSSGVVLGNTNNTTATITNNGVARAIGDIQSSNLFDLTGMAYEVRNGAGGVVNFTNNGTVDAAPLITAGMVPAADIPVITVDNPLNGGAGAGAKVNFTNNLGATITGRIAFQGSALGNTFINAGTLNGSLSLGAGGATGNTFIAVTGSSVQSNGRMASATGVAGRTGLQFAAAGLVDGGLNGANTLILQNVAAVGNPGIGSPGTGTVSATTYKNFPNLKVNSGTWTIQGPLLSGFASPTVELKDGVASIDNASVFGTATVAANGGTLRTMVAPLNLANAFTLGTGGLTIDAFNQLTLSGQLSGSGTLTKNGTGILVLDNVANDYSGGTTLKTGTLVLGSAAALGRGGLSVTGASTLQNTTAQTLGTGINLGAALGVGSADNLALTGKITGNGSLAKIGTGTLTLSGANDFSGGVSLHAGSLIVDSNDALGTGVLTVGVTGVILDNARTASLDNNIAAGSNRRLILAGSNALTLNGTVSGTGGLDKNGAADLTLNGANTYSGGVQLNAGKLIIGNDRALGSGIFNAAAGTTLDTDAARIVTNATVLGGNVTVAGSNDLTLSGRISSTGGLTKNGAASLTLAGINDFLGGVALNAGTLLLDNGSALGTGTLTTAAGTTLGASSNLTATNLIGLNGDLTINGGGNLSLNGVISGSGNLTKNGSSILQLAGANTFQGNVLLNAGTLYIGSADALGQGRLIASGGTLDAMSTRAVANDITLNGAMAVGGLSNLTLQGVIDGNGSLTKGGAANLNLTGVNTYSGGTFLNGGSITIDNAGALGSGDLTIGGGASLIGSAPLSLGQAVHLNAGLTLPGSDALTLGGMIDGSAGLTKTGTGALTLSGSNTYGGGTTLSNGTLIVASNTALGSGALTAAGGTSLDSSAAVTLINRMDTSIGGLNVLGSHDLTLQGKIAGAGGLTKNGSATLTLAGANTYAGNTQVNAGALLVDGSVSGAVTANSGGTLGGIGRIAGDAEIASGATLSPGHSVPGTLTVDGNLTLHANSATRFELGQAGVVGGASNDLVSVGGNLTLGGALTANAASAGWYRLFNYDGSLSGSFSSTQVNSTQSGFTPGNHSVDMGTTGQITLSVMGAGQSLQFWNGGQTSGNGSIAGGAGTWSASGTNWTDSTGTATQGWNGSVAVFGGSSGGNVSVVGAQSFDTLQFSTNGYNLTGGNLAFSPASGTQGTLNTDAGISAAIATTIVDGSGTSLLKVGGGTLTLSGSNTYSGGTTVAEGTLVAANNNALGIGAVTVDNTAGRNATLRIDSGVTLANTVTLTHGGGLNNAGTLAGNLLLDPSSANHVRLQAGSQILGNLDLGSNLGSTLTLESAGNAVQLHSQAVRGSTTTAGGLVKSGAGTWVLDRNLTPGATNIVAGTLQLGNGGTVGSLGAGSLSNNGTLAIDRSDAIMLANQITGSGNLVQNGAGTTTLTGVNQYTGGTSINNGRLVASAAGLGSGAIVNNAALELNQVTDATLAQAIGGTGSLTKTGAGSLTLAGANTSTGSTTINAGKLIASVANLGSGAIANNAALELNQASDATLAQAIGGSGSLTKTGAGSLTLAGASTSTGGTTINAGKLIASVANLGSGAITNNAALELNQASDATLAQAISGTGSLTKTGAGSLTLAGANTSTGSTTINAGKLVASVANLGSGAITNNAVLELNQTSDTTLAQAIGGSGSLTKTGAGSLTLAGASTSTGGTTINAGKLIASVANLGSGAITNNAALELNQASDATLAQAISGTGSLTKTGSGRLTLTGDSSAFAGNTLLNAGALALHAGAALGGNLTVASGASLSGSGAIGSTTLASGSVIAPGSTGPSGHAYGTLTINGDLTFLAGSSYQVHADPASNASDRIAVSGTASLAGGVLHVGPEAGFDAAKTYTILMANAVNGTFNTVSSNYAYLNPSLSYGAQQVKLQLERKQTAPSTPIAFADAAITSNQRSVANALDSLPSGSALHKYILTLPEGAPPEVFNSLSGEAHASVVSSLLGSTSSPRTLPLQRLRTNLNAGMSPGAPTAQAGGPLPASALPSSNAQPAWAELLGNWQTLKENGNAAQVRQHTGGLFIGADHEVGHSGWRLGAAVGYTDSKINVDDRSSQADVSGYSATLYGGKSFAVGAGKLNFLAGAAYTWHDVNTKRYATVAGTQEKLTADYGANTTQLFTELGYSMLLTDSTRIEPFVGFAWSDLRTRGFSESGGSAALNGQSSSEKQTSSTLGLRTQTDFDIGRAEARLHAMAGWRHAFGGLAAQTTLAFEGSQAFTVAGTPIARNAALAELGAEVAVSRDTTMALTYNGQYGGGNREHAGSLNVRWRY
ncbi:autotransporter-associated beta strand repeat-containing protein [Achromobacter pestifer]|uniref:Autotransporter-associated beta strand repeat-containing protein n=1 Tax=Achromobacter pestifer TaxID=1353889 RepID=A0A7D4DZ81_9BURK|nr:autotransporter-associated beta strand repeat-containing protein [Achromobacter pestifer]QKH37508.1 autotransporter-associated beta strand repeat-containing protein [Achromobacter pestifer]